MIGHARHDALARAALVVAAGGVLVGLTQQAPELGFGVAGKALLVAGAAVIILGLTMAIRSFARRGGADQ